MNGFLNIIGTELISIIQLSVTTGFDYLHLSLHDFLNCGHNIRGI